MPKQAKPWHSETRGGGGWYVCKNGKQKFLGKQPEGEPVNKAKPPKHVIDEWHRVMSLSEPETKADYRLVEIVGLYLEFRKEDRPDLIPTYEPILMRLCKHKYRGQALGDVLVNAALDACHLESWLRTHDSPATKQTYGRIARAVTQWALDSKGINVKSNPWATVKLPNAPSRTATITEAQHRALVKRFSMAGRKSTGDLATVLEVLWQTGARPGEVYNIEASDLQKVETPEGVRWFLRLTEHKTKDRTGKDRIIGVTPKLKKILDKQAKRYPTGPLFRGRNGQRFTTGSVHANFQTVQAEGIIPDEVTPYAYRHTFATDSIEAGISDVEVAKMLGHSSTAMLAKHYDHSRLNVAHVAGLFGKAPRR